MVYNQTNGTGGGIANFGVTKILGRSDQGKDWKSKDKDKHQDGDGRSTISNNSALYDGGGIHNNGTLTVEHTRLSYNNTIGTFITLPLGGAGGGISNSRSAVLDNVQLDNNTAGFRGGGIRGGINSTTEVRNTEVNNNRAGSEGGGIFTDGAFYFARGTIHHNEAGQRGGGVYNQIGQFTAEDTGSARTPPARTARSNTAAASTTAAAPSSCAAPTSTGTGPWAPVRRPAGSTTTAHSPSPRPRSRTTSPPWHPAASSTTAVRSPWTRSRPSAATGPPTAHPARLRCPPASADHPIAPAV
ncbi:hypothetical protein NKG94_02870 [Micromonospora sp. M12]